MNNHTDKADDVATLVDREYAEAWKPSAGDKLVGTVVEIGQRDGDFGTYPIVTIRQDDGAELALHAFHSVVANELARSRPQVGERIAIKYVGLKAGVGGGASYHAYKVAVDRPEPAFNWGAFGDTNAAPVDELPPDAETWQTLPGADDDTPPF